MKWLFISDQFVEDLPQGGAERADYAIFKELRSLGHECVKIHSFHDQLKNYLEGFDGRIYLSHFFGLSSECRELIINKFDYILTDHDSKFENKRDLSQYQNFQIPKENLINLDLYQGARKVFLQSKRHYEITKLNLGFDNLVGCGNFWDEDDLRGLSALRKPANTGMFAVLDHQYWQKNTKGAVSFCQQKGLDFSIIKAQDHDTFLQELSKFKGLVFLPLVFETYSRVCCEARCLGLQVHTNSNPSFFSEPYGHLKGEELIEALRENNKKIIKEITD